MANHGKADKPKKRKLTIAIDEETILYFQMAAHKDGDRPYQPLMNLVLREYVAAKVKADLEALNLK